MDDLVAEEQPQASMAGQDPMAALQQDPTAMLQRAAGTPGSTQGMAVDPEILAALGNFA